MFTCIIALHFFLVVPPSPPLIIVASPIIQEMSAELAMVVIEWIPPTDDGGAGVDNYTINISPFTQLSATDATSTTVTITVDYNVNYTLNIVATNCAGNSVPDNHSFSVRKFC